jgi:hypothetical protein
MSKSFNFSIPTIVVDTFINVSTLLLFMVNYAIRRTISLTVDEDLLNAIENRRRDVPMSKFLRDIIAGHLKEKVERK